MRKSDLYQNVNSWFAVSQILIEILEEHTLNSVFLCDNNSLNAPGFAVTRIRRRQQDRLAEASYSCNCWVEHLCDCYSSQTVQKDKDLQDGSVIQDSLGKKYLQRLEALRGVSEGVFSMSKLEH
ncbi:hypothetical protein TSTA_107960 [Talaromyces stipitatus ATCC 10500]|uniref:Uncharacterized protein n=1 Tax=Talaromyces stipitatus (strain ATCC 10500 / CBS 375.48 / QM 6759 / NRRL 1006) TaxID=441959 RepID=B8MUA2_TALSN|nr:uncharacterized protein TSTA_107960 [Talaromyces stipitatus ATCC 10500]EED11605.1 hypothetical protein TSTA_107960 [Talaromyces stipitatus ATCC 10500]